MAIASEPKKKEKRFLPAETKKLSKYIAPMLAKETATPFDDKNWIYEIKWDGYRAIADINDSDVLLYSRNGNTFNASYPIIVDALKKLNIHAVLDGEVVVTDENGRADFQLLQYYRSNSNYPIQYYVFDILSFNGKNSCDLPLTDRKRILKQLLPKNNQIIKYSRHVKEHGIDFFNVARENDLEGIIAKKADSLYYPGIRTSGWLKIKYHKTQEAIIAGFTEPAGGRKYFGSLVLGIRDGNKLKYIGHTGSGFDTVGLKKMSEQLRPIIQEQSPFDEKIKTNMPVTWVKPVLVCEVKYSEWTRDSRLRHPIFLRLREDKKADEVTIDAVKPVKKPGINNPVEK